VAFYYIVECKSQPSDSDHSRTRLGPFLGHTLHEAVGCAGISNLLNHLVSGFADINDGDGEGLSRGHFVLCSWNLSGR
jgi:hypothetical protein